MVKSKCLQLSKSTIAGNDTPPALTSVTQNMTPCVPVLFFIIQSVILALTQLINLIKWYYCI